MKPEEPSYPALQVAPKKRKTSAEVAVGASVAPASAGLLTGIAACVGIFFLVPYLWRCGMRGLPVGLVIGMAIPMLILIACAAG